MNEITDEYEFSYLMCFNKYKVLVFYHNRCMECKHIFHSIELLEMNFPQYDFNYINTDYNKTLVKEFNITHVPTLVFLQDSKVVEKIVGYRSYIELENILNNITH